MSAQPPAEETPLRGWVIFALFQQMGSFSVLISFTFGVMLPSIREDVGLTTVQAGMLAAIAWIVSAGTAVPFGAWFSRFNPVRLVAVVTFLVAATVALQSVATSFAMLFAIRFASVLFQAMQAPARPILIRQWLALRHIALANGLSFAFHSVIQAVALSVMAGVITWLGGWRATYVALGGVMAVLAMAWSFVARQRPGAAVIGERPGGASLRVVLRYPQIMFLAGAQMAPAALWTALLTFLPTYLVDDRDMSLGIAGLSSGLLYWGAAASGVLAGPAARLVPSRRLLIAGPAALFLVGGAGVLVIPGTASVAVFALVLGMGWLMQPIISTLPFELPGIEPRELAVINGFMMMTASFGFAVGPLLAGFIADQSGSMFAALGTVTILCLASVGLGLAYPDAGGTAGGAPTARGVALPPRRVS